MTIQLNRRTLLANREFFPIQVKSLNLAKLNELERARFDAFLNDQNKVDRETLRLSRELADIGRARGYGVRR
jgi:hypothetical protein